MPLQVRQERQLNPVADEVAAITAVVRPILQGALFTLRGEIVAELGGIDAVSLRMLARVYEQGDGDCGICFEYAIHDAVARSETAVVERLHDAVSTHCNVRGDDLASILFAIEKAGSENLIDTRRDLITDDSVVLSGSRGRPAKLSRHLDGIAAAFRRPAARANLPQSISGLWKADLFLGHADADRWVGTTAKINPARLESARGLRIGVVPSRQGMSDAIRREGNLVVCPVPYDGSFMQVFYEGWEVVQQVIAAGARMPDELHLPRPYQRHVARYLVDRREHPVVGVVAALAPLAQPHLLEASQHDASLIVTRDAQSETGAVVAPQPVVSE